ncbi:MAG TPA: response regulator [Kofleriaceae bacterium]|nr:response regulator [Kofleriaceae bacterium]
MAKDPYRYFRVEARELADQLAHGSLALEKAGGGSAADVARLLRVAHTLKGAARVVRQTRMADAAHALEDVLEPFRDTGAVGRAEIDALLHHVDAIVAALADVAAPPDAAKPAASTPELAPLPVPDEVATVRAELRELDTLLDGLAECRALLDSHERRVAGVADRDLELELRRGVEQLGRELRQVRDLAEQLRLVAAAALFDPLERIARDTARRTGAQVRVETRGGELRLDTGLLDAVLPALVQLVRNAVAHGLEPPAARAAAGKPTEGRITVDVSRRGQRVVFSVADDGRGIDVAAVRAAAQRGGALAGGHEPEHDELLALLLRGGLSTASTVTDISGRGVGLDIVRVVAERLGGKARIATRAGAGTSFELAVPLSLAAVESLVIEAGGATSTIPLDAVRATLRTEPTATGLAGNAAVIHEGRVIPFLPLARALRGSATRTSGAWTTLVVDSGGERAAVGVDRLLGSASVVMRPLPRYAPADPLVAGASLDHAGVPQLALDPAGVVAAAHRAVPDARPVTTARLPILVVDDSLTTRMLEQSILEAAGWDVDLATSGEEGLEVARSRPHALILVDVEMPGIDGFTFVEEVRADPLLAQTPAILVTSRNAPEDRRRGRDAGAQGYVVKSEFDQNELCALIDRLVRR